MLPFTEALARLLASASPLGPERVALDDACGRVLAEDIAAPMPLPPFDYSSMDGYALRADDLTGDGPWEMRVVGESAAGGDTPDLVPGTACRIYTGARLPAGADTVVMQERVERRGDAIALSAHVPRGNHLRRRGEDLAEGAIGLARGTRLTAGRVALAAALERPELSVARRPIVTILCSGDELRSPGRPGKAGSIPESNGYFVAATARGAGAIARVSPFVPDEPEAARRAVADALRASDVVVTIGGVSVGDRDVMRTALEAAGVTIDFWKVKIKPGKPLAVGRAAATQVIGLPGNPASASLTFLLFGMPLLRALQGDRAPLPPRLRIALRSRVEREPGREEFLRARLEMEGGAPITRIMPNQASGAVTSFAEADALVVIPADRGTVEEGEAVEVIRIADI
ncbi:Molybdopterin biosynthesis protein MoeA [Minicystis rosea]|nr:Molybdopterin biosynthesis protein MoeA [Minicystis rosea]